MNPERFVIQGVTTQAALYNLPDHLRPGELPRIEQALNAQEVFEKSSRVEGRSLHLEGENWMIDFDTRSIVVAARAFLDCRAVEEGVSFFVGQLKKAIHCHVWANEITVNAAWPLEPNPQRKKSAGQILYERSSRLKEEQIAMLAPGGALVGAGISLLGLTSDDFMWILETGPFEDELIITLQMIFREPDRPDWPDDELEVIEANIKRTYSMMDTEVKAFIDSVMP